MNWPMFGGMFCVFLLLCVYVHAWYGRMHFFDSFCSAVERGEFTVHDGKRTNRPGGGYNLRIRGIADGRSFVFNASRSQRGLHFPQIHIEDHTVIRVGHRSFGDDCFGTWLDEPRLLKLFEIMEKKTKME